MRLVCDLSLSALPHRPRRGWSPQWLFRAGAAGVWFDPSDRASLFQDSAGTVPVTASGQPVGRMLDKSGNGNHAVQAVSASRPTYQTAAGLHWLAFDGVDDSISVPMMALTASEEVTIFAGLLAQTGGSGGMICEFSDSITASPASFFIFQNPPFFGSAARGTAAYNAAFAASSAVFTTPFTAVLTALHSIAADQSALRVNGAASGTNGSGDRGAGTFGNYPFHIGRRAGASLPFNGRLYGLVVQSGLAGAPDLARTEQFLAQATGVTV